MRFAGAARRALLVVVAFSLLAGPATVGSHDAAAQESSSRFAEALTARDPSSSLAGPFSGELVQSDGFSVTTGAGLSAEGFSARATFVNPDTEMTTPWDFGFTFHNTGEAAQQVLIDSTGLWYYSPFPEGTLESGFVPIFDASPGGENTIDLIVDGGTALLGVNAEFLTSIALPPAVASDVQIGSGYFTSTTVAGRAIPYRDFEVWALPGVSLPEPTPAFEATDSPAPALTVSPDDAAAFAMVLAAQSQAEPLAGPFNANLTEEDGRIALSWADVDLVDFHARATFSVPRTASDTAWDVGFMFRTSPAGTLRVAVATDGAWYFAVGAASPAAFGSLSGVLTDPGGANTLDLIVAEETAVLGVNGEFAALINLPADSAAGDVAAGSAFFTDQTLPERVTPFREFVVLPFDLDAISSAQPPAAASDEFASLLAETSRIAPLAGPFAGRLVESSPDAAPIASAGVALYDFAAVVTFVTPGEVASPPWDAGLQFQSAVGTPNRIVLSHTGEVYVVIPEEDPQRLGNAAMFDPEPGASNTLHVFVEGDRALIGVNGTYVASAEILIDFLETDVEVGAAFFAGDFEQGRVTAYEDFQIWEIA
jgi:hypothetical protein